MNTTFNNEIRHLRRVLVNDMSAYPDLVKQLNLSALDPDASVARLLEGVAYISSDLRHYIQQQIPSLASSLINQLDADFLKPKAASAIVNLLLPAFVGQKTLSKGELLQGPNQAHFSLTSDFNLLPLFLSAQNSENKTDELLWQLSLEDVAGFEKLDLKNISVFINESPDRAFRWLYFLTKYCRKIFLSFDDECFVETSLCFQSVFQKQLLKDVSVHQLMRQFFSTPEQFCFVDLIGLEKINIPKGARKVALRLAFDRNLPLELLSEVNIFHLNCTIVENKFEKSLDPIFAEQDGLDYPLFLNQEDREEKEILALSSVSGFNVALNKTISYQDFSCFKEREIGQSYQHIVRENQQGEKTDYLRLANSEHLPQTISVDAVLCQKDLPRRQVSVGDMGELVSNKSMTCRYLTRPSVYQAPGGADVTELLSILNLQLDSLLKVDNLKKCLHTLNTTQEKKWQQCIDAIQKISSEQSMKIIRGISRSHLAITLALDEQKFSSESEIYYFANLLKAMFSQLLSMEVELSLTVYCQHSEKTMALEVISGSQACL